MHDTPASHCSARRVAGCNAREGGRGTSSKGRTRICRASASRQRRTRWRVRERCHQASRRHGSGSGSQSCSTVPPLQLRTRPPSQASASPPAWGRSPRASLQTAPAHTAAPGLGSGPHRTPHLQVKKPVQRANVTCQRAPFERAGQLERAVSVGTDSPQCTHVCSVRISTKAHQPGVESTPSPASGLGARHAGSVAVTISWSGSSGCEALPPLLLPPPLLTPPLLPP